MRARLLYSSLLAGLVILLWGWRDWSQRRALEAARTANEAVATQLANVNERLQQTEASLEKLQSGFEPASNLPATAPSVELRAWTDRISALERQARAISNTAGHLAGGGRSVAEYDPSQPPPPPPIEEPPTNTPPRGWGPEQALGPPDTFEGGDRPTAWASRETDAGYEWLAVAFVHEVEIAEVRIRESCNPGAISRVSAVANGREIVLWEGAATGGAAPRDFVIRATVGVRANNLVVHLDTARVAGWNEIDAVELVGRDGSRQWAVSAGASTTYAERTAATGLLENLQQPLVR